MVSAKHVGIIAILLIGLAISGCAGDAPETVAEEETDVTNADDILAEQGVDLTDSEIADLENDLDEFEALIAELEEDEELIVEDI